MSVWLEGKPFGRMLALPHSICSLGRFCLESLAGMEQTESELLALRREKLAALEKLGVAPFGVAFETSGDIAHVREKFAEGASFRVAGRISAHRDMGKSHFVDLKDASGRMQIYLQAKELGPEGMEVFKLLDLGDFIGVEGTCFTTKTGEPTLKVHKLGLLAKSLRPVAGGAAAEPFATRHKALGLDLYLRIAPELYLKRLLVGGFNRVFELNRNFRNEGISRKHNPEFTMLEAYWAYANFEKVADLVEELICHLAEKVCGTLRI